MSDNILFLSLQRQSCKTNICQHGFFNSDSTLLWTAVSVAILQHQALVSFVILTWANKANFCKYSVGLFCLNLTAKTFLQKLHHCKRIRKVCTGPALQFLAVVDTNQAPLFKFKPKFIGHQFSTSYSSIIHINIISRIWMVGR